MEFLQSTNDDKLLDKNSPYYIDFKKINKNFKKYMPK